MRRHCPRYPLGGTGASLMAALLPALQQQSGRHGGDQDGKANVAVIERLWKS